MKYKIEYISSFHVDVAVVVDYLKEYPNKIARIFSKIDRVLKNLEGMPELYPVYYDIPSFRFIVVEDYLVFYKIQKQYNVIEIHRLIHGRADMTKRIQ